METEASSAASQERVGAEQVKGPPVTLCVLGVLFSVQVCVQDFKLPGFKPNRAAVPAIFAGEQAFSVSEQDPTVFLKVFTARLSLVAHDFVQERIWPVLVLAYLAAAFISVESQARVGSMQAISLLGVWLMGRL